MDLPQTERGTPNVVQMERGTPNAAPPEESESLKHRPEDDFRDIIADSFVETYVIPYIGIYSLPIRMPGITLSIRSTTPSFQLTLKGGCDESAVFEMNHDPNVWKISTLDYALGRLVYDIIWEDGLTSSQPIRLQLVYSTVVEDSSYKLISQQWQLEWIPSRWLVLPKSKHWLKKIQLKWQYKGIKSTFAKEEDLNIPEDPEKEEKQLDLEETNFNRSSLPLSLPPTCEFKLAVATIPLKLLPVSSTNGTLDLADIDSPILSDGKLSFSQVFGVWMVFDGDVNWSQWTPSIAYTLQPE